MSHSLLLFTCILCLLLSSCRLKKEAAKKSVPTEKNIVVLIEKLRKNEFRFEWLSIKASGDFTLDGKSNSFKASIRVKCDSIIWISIMPIVGVEFVRAVITVDSVKVVNRFLSEYIAAPFDTFFNKYDIDLDFEMLQALLVGNSTFISDEELPLLSTDHGNYLFSSMKKRKLKRAVSRSERYERKSGKYEKKSDQAESERKSEKFEKKAEKFDKKSERYDFVAHSVWLHPDHFKISRIAVNDLKVNQSLDAEYDDFVLTDLFADSLTLQHQTGLLASTTVKKGTQLLARKIHHTITSRKKAEVVLEYSKVITDKPQSFPFSIPEGFNKKEVGF